MTTGKSGLFYSNRIIYIPLCDITVPTYFIQKTRISGLDELRRSILRWGIIQPISVRRIASGYELVSGTRRYFAARSAGFKEIPCIVLNADASESELIALTENIHKRELDPIMEARAIWRLIQLHGVSSADVSRYTGLTKSEISAMLRLLSLPESDSEKRTEDITKRDCESSRPEPKMAVSSTRIFTNTVEKACDMMRKCGYDADISTEETAGETRLSIVLSQNRRLNYSPSCDNMYQNPCGGDYMNKKEINGVPCDPNSNCIDFERVSYSLIEEPEVCEWCVHYDDGVCKKSCQNA